jgi:protease I
MLDAFTENSPQAKRTNGQDQSDAQRDTPPGLAVTALRWSPKPSAIAVVGIALVAAARRGRGGQAARD